MPLKRTPRYFFSPQAAQPLHLLSAAALAATAPRLAAPRPSSPGEMALGGMVLGARCWGHGAGGHGAGGHGMPSAQPVHSRPHQGSAPAWALWSQAGCLHQEPGEVRVPRTGAAEDPPPGLILALVSAPFLCKEGGEERPSSLGTARSRRGLSSPRRCRPCLEGDFVAAAAGRGEVLERHGAALRRAG